jgi:hypothetical protein
MVIDNTEKTSMIDKIMKLLELGKDERGHEGERNSANDMAARLMAKHAIDFTDLRSSKPKSCVFEKQVIDPMDEVFCQWEAVLADGIARAFDCKAVHSRHPVWTINFLGTKTDLEIVIFFYRHLRRTVGRKAELGYKGKRDQETYAHGMVATINSRLDDLYKRREQVMESDCRALIIVKKDDLKLFIKDQFPALSKIRPQKLSNGAAYAHGKADGQNVGLARPISGGAGEKMRTIRGH